MWTFNFFAFVFVCPQNNVLQSSIPLKYSLLHLTACHLDTLSSPSLSKPDLSYEKWTIIECLRAQLIFKLSHLPFTFRPLIIWVPPFLRPILNFFTIFYFFSHLLYSFYNFPFFFSFWIYFIKYVLITLTL